MKRIPASVLLGISLFLIVSMFLRTFALWRDLVFVYDQGRDALMVQQILQGNLTLIGPTTGLYGVFLGPFFYYFLVPFYIVGRGNPIVPMYAIAFIQASAALLLYVLAQRISGVKAGILAAFFYTISFREIMFARWLSNPAPLPFFSAALFLSLQRALQTKRVLWFVMTGLLMGMCLQLEAANAVFFFPTLAVILLVEAYLEVSKKKHAFSLALYGKCLFGSWRFYIGIAAGIGATLLPQLAFEIRHGFLSTRGLITSFQTTHDVSALANLPKRAALLFELYADMWFPHASWMFAVVLLSTFILLAHYGKALWRSLTFRIVSLWVLVPLIGELLYTGNHGNFWGYYAIAQYGPFFVFVASLWAYAITKQTAWRKMIMMLGIGLAIIGGLWTNAAEWKGFLHPYEQRLSLSLQLDAIDWIRLHTQGEPFGVWVYTPSAQDEAYKYLFSLRGKQTGVYPVEHPEHTKHMYLVVEDDPVYWKRRQEWITEKSSIGTIVDQRTFGAVTVFAIERN